MTKKIKTIEYERSCKTSYGLYIFCNDKHPFLSPSLHFTALPHNCRHFTSYHLNFTHLHFTTLSFGLTPFQFPTAPFHFTSLHFTSLHFTSHHYTSPHFTSLHCIFRRFSPHFYSFRFIPPIIAFLTLFRKILGSQGKFLTLL